MSGLNRVILIGNLGKDPEMRFTGSGKAVTDFSLAVNDGKETEWVNIVTWEKTAELCNQYLNKGSSVCIEGRLRSSTWDDDEGKKHYKTEVVANRVIFLGKKDQQDDEPDTGIQSDKTIEPDDIPF